MEVRVTENKVQEFARG